MGGCNVTPLNDCSNKQGGDSFLIRIIRTGFRHGPAMHWILIGSTVLNSDLHASRGLLTEYIYRAYIPVVGMHDLQQKSQPHQAATRPIEPSVCLGVANLRDMCYSSSLNHVYLREYTPLLIFLPVYLFRLLTP